MSHNRLAAETSPYLLQHQDNPVHWWPWGPDALAEARRQDKPVLLSVGYAACHWCHVMAHESFEDADTAAVMNDLFVNIKVDREERPDVDALYMAALHQLGEQGGWPLTMFLTPEGEPFWGGTYFPRTSAYGRPGFTHVLREVARIYAVEPDKVRHNAALIKDALTPRPQPDDGLELSEDTLAQLAGKFPSVLDPVNGGLRGAPKFPNYSIFAFLWKLGLRHGSDPCLAGVETMLVHACQGGVYDHLGGGFARYAVDERWLVPHFEKMLYDNALLVELMTEVWKERCLPLLERRVAETVDWLLGDMAAPDGGFASSYDADSEGEEGKFYVWSRTEIMNVLGEQDGALFAEVYDVSAGGNWEGVTILNRLHSLDLRSPEEEARLARMRGRLLAARETRVRPGWDDKVLADWNGLAIGALVNAAGAFDRPDWLEAAQGAYGFIKARMTDEDRLWHSFRAGETRAPGVASDYANMIAAALRLYQATGDDAVLDDARRWTAVMEAHFWDGSLGCYYLTPDDAGDLPLRPLSDQDDATPNANGMMIVNLAALNLLTGDDRYRRGALAVQQALVRRALAAPIAHTGILGAAMDLLVPQLVVMIDAGSEQDRHAMARAVSRLPMPGGVVVRLAEGRQPPPGSPAHGKSVIDGKPTVYVCIGPQCSLPVTDPDAVAPALRAARLSLPPHRE